MLEFKFEQAKHITEEQLATFAAKLHDALVDKGYEGVSVTYQDVGEGCFVYILRTTQGHCTYLVDSLRRDFIRVVDMEPGFGV